MSDAKRENQNSRRGRRRLLLLLLLAALIALLIQRPDLRRQAADTAYAAVLATFDITPRKIYALRLRLTGLADSELGRRWTAAITHAADAPIRLDDRYQNNAQFDADRIEAHVYTETLKRGERMQLRLMRTDAGDGQLFASLERQDDTDDWNTLARLAGDSAVVDTIAEHDGIYRVVLQPELAATVGYRLATASGGSLNMPVAGAAMRDIGSGFGAPRDGGTRNHHGVDIFANRGTPVIAVASGGIRTGTRGIGGNHIWLSSGMLGITGTRYYYAHLDSFAVESNDRVQAGDTIGRVGNTGNARTTPPHLHFGIYTAGGAIDPAPFLQPAPRLPNPN